MSPETRLHPRLPKVGCKVTHEDLEPKRKIGNDSIGVSGSLFLVGSVVIYNHPNWQEKYHLYIYITYILPIGVIICYYMLPIPPIKGTRKPIDMNLSLKSGGIGT